MCWLWAMLGLLPQQRERGRQPYRRDVGGSLRVCGVDGTPRITRSRSCARTSRRRSRGWPSNQAATAGRADATRGAAEALLILLSRPTIADFLPSPSGSASTPRGCTYRLSKAWSTHCPTSIATAAPALGWTGRTRTCQRISETTRIQKHTTTQLPWGSGLLGLGAGSFELGGIAADALAAVLEACSDATSETVFGALSQS